MDRRAPTEVHEGFTRILGSDHDRISIRMVTGRRHIMCEVPPIGNITHENEAAGQKVYGAQIKGGCESPGGCEDHGQDRAKI